MASSNHWIWAVVAVVIAVVIVMSGQFGAEDDARLRKDGVAGAGRVLSATQTGSWVNNNPVVELQLEVRSPDASGYQVTLRSMIPQVNLAAIQPGAVLKVKIDRKDPGRVVLDEAWAR